MFRWTADVDLGCVDTFRGAAAVAVEHDVYIFSRYAVDNLYGRRAAIHVSVFNAVSLRWKDLSSVAAGTQMYFDFLKAICTGHRAVAIGRVVYEWGGKDPYADVLHALDVDTCTWSTPTVSGAVPEPRSGHSACALGTAMVICGGQEGWCYAEEMLKLDTETMVWSVLHTRAAAPPARYGHSATVIGAKIFVFEGCYDIAVFDSETSHWLSAPPPVRSFPREIGSTFAYDGELYIACRASSAERSINLRKFNPESYSWTWVEAKGDGPPPSPLLCAYCCVAGDRLVVFDGGRFTSGGLWILELRPCLKTLCKLAVIRYDLDQSELPHDARWELSAMKNEKKKKRTGSQATPEQMKSLR